MHYLSQIFNNRELSLLIWISVFIIALLPSKQIRQGLKGILMTLFAKQILVPIIVMILYISLIIFIFFSLQFWDVSLLKDTIFWAFGVAFVLFFNTTKAIKEDDFFKKTILDNLKLILILEFILNLYSFNIYIELIIVPFLIFIVLLSAFSNGKEEYKLTKRFFDYLIAIIGIGYLIYAIFNIIIDFNNFATLTNLKSFLLPPILTIIFLPFIYFIALYSLYQTFFIRIKFGTYNNKKIEKYTRKKVFKMCLLNFNKLKKISKELMWFKAKDKKEVKELLRPYK